MFNLLRDNDNQKYAIIDGESCNLNLVDNNNLCWQWGILECKGKNIIKKHNLYIKWSNSIPISRDAARITKFSQFKIDKEGIKPKLALEILDFYIYNSEYLLIIHNGLNFDVYLHNIFRLNLGYKTDYSYITRLLDTNALARGIKLNNKYTGKINNDFLAYQYRMSSIKMKGLKTNLTQLGRENQIEHNYESLHEGISDCELLYKVWWKWIIWHIDISV